MWHNDGHSLCRCGYMPVRRFLCLFWRENHTKGLHARFSMRLEEDKGRKGTEQNRRVDGKGQSTEVGGSRQLREGGRTEKSTEQGNWQKSGEAVSQEKEAEQRSRQSRAIDRSRGKPSVKRRKQRAGQKREVDRRELSTEVGGSRLLGCEDPKAGLANVTGWVSIPSDFVGISLKYMLAIAPKMLGKCHKLLPSC